MLAHNTLCNAYIKYSAQYSAYVYIYLGMDPRGCMHNTVLHSV